MNWRKIICYIKGRCDTEIQEVTFESFQHDDVVKKIYEVCKCCGESQLLMTQTANFHDAMYGGFFPKLRFKDSRPPLPEEQGK